MELEYQMKNISYLRARDPSILTWNSHLSDVKMNLEPQMLECTSSSGSTTTNDRHFQVYLRVKKNENFEHLYEILDDAMLRCKVPEGAQCIRNMRDGSTITKTFTFSKIFGPQSTQTGLFNSVIKKKVLHFINGYNGSLLTYGASGSGKTFTIVGTADEPGIIPRALEYVFRTLPKLPEHPRIKPTASGGVVRLTESDCELEKNIRQNILKGSNVNIDRMQHTRTYKAMQQRLSEEPVALIMDDISNVSLGIWVSFAEIYNENAYDLLSPEPPRGRPRQKLRLGYSNGSAYIKDLTCVSVSSGLQAYQILQYGLHNLKYAATSLNDHSSRSHSIFTIKLAQASDTQEGVSVSSFNLCDLAGSERLKKTHNAGERLKESNNINTSLLVLGRCVSLVRESQKHNDNRLIPFRESKLTQLFQKALLGHEAISMIVNINPTREMFDESQHALNFSAIAKDVVVEQQQLIKYSKNNRFSRYMESRDPSFIPEVNESEIEELQEQVQLLYNELQQQKIDAQDDREHVINTYKRLLADTSKYWENRCQELQELLTKSMRTNTDNTQQESKRRKMSVIDLDSSSEEDEEKNYVVKIKVESTNCKEKEFILNSKPVTDNENNVAEVKDEFENCKDKECNTSNNLVTLQGNSTQLKLLQTKNLELQVKELELQKLVEQNESLKKTLEEAGKAYLELHTQCQHERKELESEVIRQQEQINELNTYLDAFHKRKATNCDADEDEENENIFNYAF